MWWVGQLNNYVPCSFVLDDDTTFLRKYAATLEASFTIPQIESADQECKPIYQQKAVNRFSDKNNACVRYKILQPILVFSIVGNFLFPSAFVSNYSRVYSVACAQRRWWRVRRGAGG